jgi:hypothetical protein
MKILWNFRVLATMTLLLAMLSNTAIAAQPAQTFNVKDLAISVNTNPFPVGAGVTFPVTVTVNKPVNGNISVILGSTDKKWTGPINGTTATTEPVFKSANPTTDYISVCINDVYGDKLIAGTTPVTPVNQAFPIGITHR